MKYLLTLLLLSFTSLASAGGAPIAIGKYGTPTPSFLTDVARGAVEGYSSNNAIGHASVGTTYQTVWDCTATKYTWPSTALAMTIVSDDGNDNSAGTGARTVMVNGLDSNWDEITTAVSLTGLTPAAIPGTFIRINSAYVVTAGTNDGALGVLTIASAGTTYACITNGYNRTLMGIFTIPDGYYGIILQGKGSAGAGKDIEIDMYARRFAGLFHLGHHAHIYENNYDYVFQAYKVIPPKSDIEVRAKSAAAGAEMSISFDVLLIEERFVDPRN